MLAQMISILAAAILLLAIALLLLGWGGLLTLCQRIGLAMFGAGLVLAAIPRFQGRPPGWGDVLMLSGLVLYLGATYAPKIIQHVDGLDGKIDGRFGRPRQPRA
ncbi:hypothetical protein [Caulobacter sp. Root343]|uniref:hypothetical protein n=1 Tax=Caulobacter sp. Root343 TaxID=1736520 RepID=UPI0006F85021|nr:hypothetical protein [Caulobacter sp. Root343]KQV66652.1 hypothetical protein ASC70_12525 [Caulobacter sp. Root343]